MNNNVEWKLTTAVFKGFWTAAWIPDKADSSQICQINVSWKESFTSLIREKEQYVLLI